MKIGGKDFSEQRIETIVFPRPNGTQIVFKGTPILDLTEFDKLFPTPTPPIIVRPGGITDTDDKDPEHQENLNIWSEHKIDYTFLVTLSVTEDLVWDTVDIANPDTWKNYKEELKKANFTESEMVQLLQFVINVNALDPSKIEEATTAFLAGVPSEPNNSPSHLEDQSST